MNWETFLSIGDSITKGARTYLSYPEKTGYLLKHKLGKHWNVINISENGWKVIDILKLLDKNLHNLTVQKPGITTIMIGTNDAKDSTNKSDFRIAYEQLVFKSMIISQKKNVILIKIPRFPKGIMYPYNYKMNGLIGM